MRRSWTLRTRLRSPKSRPPRADAVAALKRPRPCKGFVRVNAAETEWCFGDMEVIVGPWLDGIVLPKLESAAMLRTIDWTLAQLESARRGWRSAVSTSCPSSKPASASPT